MVDDGGKFRESIWSIHPNWKDRFYGVLLFCGIGVFVLTLLQKEWSKKLLEIFDAVWNGIVGSVIVVWFLFQAVDWVIPRVKKHIYKIMAWGDPYREKLREQARQKELKQARKEAEEKARKEAKEEMQKQYDNALRQLKIPEDKIQQAHHLSDALGPWRPPPR